MYVYVGVYVNMYVYVGIQTIHPWDCNWHTAGGVVNNQVGYSLFLTLLTTQGYVIIVLINLL